MKWIEEVSSLCIHTGREHPATNITFTAKNKAREAVNASRELHADVIIAGGGLGGVATALACCRNGLNVIMTEETGWIGGQVSQQGFHPMNTNELKPSAPFYRVQNQSS